MKHYRTDYPNDDAWTKFCDALRNAEKESLGEEEGVDMEESNVDEKYDGDSESDSDSGTPQFLFISFIISFDPSLNLAGISNIAALRHVNDVDVAPAPKKPGDAPTQR